MRKLYILLLSLVVALSSCTTMLETASTMDVTSSLNTAVVADLDVAPERITYTMTPQKAVRRGGLANIKRVAESEALEKNGGGDLLLNPEYTVTQRRGLFSKKVTSVSVSGRPANYINVRSLPDSVWCNPVFRGVATTKRKMYTEKSIKPKRENTQRYLPLKKTTWMLRVGVGSTRFSTGEDGTEVSRRCGYSVGLEFNRAIRQKGAYWGMDFTFASRGFDAEFYGHKSGHYYPNHSVSRDVYHESRSLYAHNFQWNMLNFGWKIRLGRSGMYLDPHFGVYTSLDYAVNFELDQNYYTQNWYNQQYGHLYKENDVHDAEDFGEQFDVGLKFGIGFWFNRKWNADFTIQKGFSETYYDNGYPSLQSGHGCLNMMFRLGYAF